MGGQAGSAGGMPDPNQMQEMMKNPSMQKILDNPEFIDNMINMIKSPMARPQMEQMAKQMNVSPDTLLSWVSIKFSDMKKGVRKIFLRDVHDFEIIPGSFLLIENI